jgi:CotH kinase protein/Lamin Tail Domain
MRSDTTPRFLSPVAEQARALGLWNALPILAIFVLSSFSSAVTAQDWYDPNTLRTVNITFTQSNWEALLRANYASETDLLGTVQVDGQVYPNVGIRIRGNTSFTGLPTGSQKFSLKLEMDVVNPNQDLMGYDSINLNNGWRDPTFTREVEFNNYLAQFTPNALANNVIVTINGENWGVYNNVQQTDKAMLRRYFSNADGLRVRCFNNPNVPGLSYSPTLNASYEIQEIGTLTLPQATAEFIELTRILTQATLTNPSVDVPNMDRTIAIDASTWTVALENLLTDDDSYINKGCDFMTYRNPVDGRTAIIQRDANETWTQTTWAINRNFNQTNKPFINRVLAVPELRQRYMAHYRTIRQGFVWTGQFQPLFEARRTALAAAVAADTKKIYTTQNFTEGFGTNTITLTNRITNTPASGLAGGAIPGVQQFIEGRGAFLSNAVSNPELAVTGPNITAVQASNSTPAPSTPVFITADVQQAGAAITRVELFYRPDPTSQFLRISMLDDGLSGDDTAGDGRFGVRLPGTGSPGTRVAYYVMATSANSFNSLSFLPTSAEQAPRFIEFGLSGAVTLQITEYLYSGNQGEFVELTNRGVQAIDLTGWTLKDDQVNLPGFSLTPAGVLQPGQTLVVTDNVEAAFRAAWNLPAGSKILGQLGVIGVGGENFGRSDQINVFDSGSVLVDRLSYGDQTFPGTIRAQNISGQAPCAALGQNTIVGWVLASVGDVYGSVLSNLTVTNLSDIGSPGVFVGGNCSGDQVLFANGFESVLK